MNLLKFLYLFILIIFFVGCKSENSSEPADIASLESSLDNNASQGDQVKLLQKYQQAYQDAQGDAAKESNYLFKMASLNSKMGRASTATSRLI